MKLHISLQVLALTATAWASNSPSVVIGFCKHTSIIGDLKPEQYFNKQWYIWKSHGGFLWEKIGSCAGMDTKMEGNNVQLLNFQYEPLLGIYLTARGDANAAYIQKKGLAFPVDYNIRGMNFTLAFNILGTDNENWAAVYLCRQLVGLKIEMSWLLVRDRNATLTADQQAAMSDAISNVGLTLEDYEFAYNLNCGADEPRL